MLELGEVEPLFGEVRLLAPGDFGEEESLSKDGTASSDSPADDNDRERTADASGDFCSD